MAGLGRGAAAVASAALVGAGVGLSGFSALASRRIAEAYPACGAFIAMESGRLHFTERRPDGACRGTILLLHGASGNQADMMLPLGARLAAAGFRVVAPDRPGHGWSDRPGGAADASPKRQAALIRAALATVGVERATVVGHSWSGALAVAFALDQPDLTEALVLLAPATHPWPGGVSWYYGPASSRWTGPLFNRLLTVPVGLLSLRAGIRSVFAPQEPPPAYAERTGLTLLLRPSAFMANAQDVSGLNAFVATQAPRMGAITIPTAIVTGDHDGVVLTRLHTGGSLRAIPRATLTVLPGVGHSPHWAEPARVAAEIVRVAERAAKLAGAGQG